MTKFKHFLGFCGAPLILGVVFCFHLYNVRFHDLSPWKGGGFGMFSTVDRRENRFLRCYLTGGPHDLPVKVPRKLRRLARTITAIPSRERLLRLANQLSQVKAEKKIKGATGVRVELWRIHFDSPKRRITAYKFLEAASELPTP